MKHYRTAAAMMIVMALCTTVPVLGLTACSGTGGGADSSVKTSEKKQSPPVDTTPLVTNVEYEVYQTFELTDPEFSNMVALRTLLPEGWSGKGGVDWSFQSADAPAQIWTQFSSADGEAFLCTISDRCYGVQYAMGSPVLCWGVEQRELPSAEQAAMEYLEQLGVTDVTFTNATSADKGSLEWNAAMAEYKQLNDSMSPYGMVVQTPQYNHIIFEGTGNLQGEAYDVRAETIVRGYGLEGSTISQYTGVVGGVYVCLAPKGQMHKYIADQLDIMANSQLNENWAGGFKQVSQMIWALLREKQINDWEAARKLSAQLSAQVDATIAHTNAWIAKTDATIFQHSSNWSDYIFDQNNYYGTDGSTVSVSSSWDHVWMGDDGSVYVSNQSDLFDNPNTNSNSTTHYTELEPIG